MLLDRIRYILGVILIIPVYPIMFFQSRKIKREFPDLPEAENPVGEVGSGPEMSILIVGESSVAGVGVATHTEGIAGQMSAELATKSGHRIAYTVVAKSGYTAQKVHEELVTEIPEKPYDLILVGLGGNDTFQVSTPWFWKRSMQALIEDLNAKFPNTPIVVICMPPVHTFTAFGHLLKFFLGRLTMLYGREIRRMAKRLDYLHYYDYVIYLEEWIARYPEANRPDDFFSDGVHPSPLTYRLWGRETARFILKNVWEVQATTAQTEAVS